MLDTFVDRQASLMRHKMNLFFENKISLGELSEDLLGIRNILLKENISISQMWEDKLTSLLLDFESFAIMPGGKYNMVYYKDLYGQWRDMANDLNDLINSDFIESLG